MKRLVIASGNPGKIKEAKEILNEYEIVPMKELGIDIDVEEDRDTSEGNARKKAEEIAKLLKNEIVIADDTGIEIEYLNGFPGVRTKRWLPGTDRDRNLGIIEKLKGVPKESRKVKNNSAMAASNGKQTISVVGVVEGYITAEPRGKNGFGFDEIFELQNGKTLAELTQEEKNEVSARKKALELLKVELKKFFDI